jgi:hypothetical protein
MLSVRSLSLATPILLVSLVACNQDEPLAPLSAAFVGGVKPPSVTSARPTGSSSVLVTWTDNTSNEDGFRIERSATPAGPWATATTTGANATSVADAQLQSEQQVCYRVIAVRKNNESIPSNAPCTTPPAAPGTLTATRSDRETVQLTWTDKSATEDGYQVQRATAEGGPYSVVADLAPGAVSYRNGGLSPSAYWYRVQAKKDGGFGDFSNLASVSHPDAPLAPSGTNAVPGGSNSVTITWMDNAANETGFRLERSPDLNSPWLTVWTIYGQNVTTTADYVPTSERQVCYRVVAFNTFGNSPPSNADCTTPPAAPSGLTATVVDYQTVNLAWTDNSAVEDGYEVQRALQGESWGTVADLPANTKSYRDVVASDATYWYMIRAKKDGGYSYSSNAVMVVVATVPPAAPSGVDATPAGSTTVGVSWSDNSSSEEGFRVERSRDGGASWQVAGTTGISIAWFWDSGLAGEQQVCYRVVAFNATGGSPSSATDCTAPPAAPTDLVATAVASDAIDLTWTNNFGVRDGYEVQRVFCYQDYYGWWICDYFSIATLGADAASYHDAGLNPSESYTYRVLARKDGGVSDPSNEASATTNAP